MLVLLDLEKLARVAALSGAGASIEAIERDLEVSRVQIEQSSKHWNAIFERDAKAHAEYSARVILGGGGASSRDVAEPAVARKAIDRKCHRCGAPKRTEPRTAYVYCDYCGALFGYEPSRHASLRDVFSALQTGVSDELRRAREAGDWMAYREAWRWPYAMDMKLSPEGWSPRIGDPAYRDAMLEYSIETCVVQNRRTDGRVWQQRAREASGKVDLCAQFPMMGDARAALREWATLHDRALDEEIALHRHAGLFERHPDALDESTYKHLNILLSAMGWRGRVSDEAMNDLFDALGIRTVDVEAVALENGSCARCGGKLLVAGSARAIVCEACGITHDVGAAIRCPSCGARVLVSARAEHVSCAWCRTVVPVV
jgi:DNA-directed RNA polymerase subunit RPC12/RpoP